MGVPHFYTWLINRFPLLKSLYSSSTLPIIDWFFMDLNGVIYKCAMDDTFAFKDMIKGRRFEEIFMHVFNYVNEIIQLVQPQKMIFLAFDGVAPRAKMNQQRSRRFKAARKYQELDNALRSYGIIEKEEHFKNNSISPGTEFMFELSRQMKFFIQRKMMEDDRWRRVKVIFSGVEVPGEGEHKTLDYIRAKSQEPGFDPNTSICIYGADADLIMLALTTHLPFVSIFREQLKPRPRNTSACKRSLKANSFDFLWINVLREYFEIEFSPLKDKMGERYNVEKIIDDFIFLCFFIGNDFLPRVFCMDIKIGTFDKLIEIFKQSLIENDGYINEKGVICWYRAVNLFKKIAEFELKFIGDKLEEQEHQQRTANRYNEIIKEIDGIAEEENREFQEEVESIKEALEEAAGLELPEETKELEQLEEEGGKVIKRPSLKDLSIHEPRKSVEEEEEEEEDLLVAGVATIEDAQNYLLTYTNEEKISRLLSSRILEKDIKFMSSLVKIYRNDINEAKHFYYESKFNVDLRRDSTQMFPILTAYMQGLQFVLSYYYTGCPSWSWFYPYYYSPLISDLSNLMNHLNLPHVANQNLIKFEKGKPYDPFKQLLLILPIFSLHLLPEPMRKVVCDENAPLHPSYPTEFDVDPFGAVFESEFIAKIPFVDEDLLDQEYKKGIAEAVLTPEEAHRNQLGTNIVYEWNFRAPETEVASSLPLYFENFKVTMNTSTFQIEDMPFDPKNILEKIPPGSKSYHESYPSLHFIPNKINEMKSFKKKEVTFYKCCFKVSPSVLPPNDTDYKKLLGQPFYCMYPFLTPCVIIGIVTPEQFITNVSYHELPFSYSKAQHKEYYMGISQNIHDYYFTEFGILFQKQPLNFAVVTAESELRKDSLGNLYCPYPIIDVIPLDLIMASSFKSHYRGDIDLAPKDLPREFPKLSEVVIATGEFVGCVARVTGYPRNGFEEQVEVRISKLAPKINNITRDIATRHDNHQNYSSAQTVAKQLGVDIAVILTILDSVIIKTEPVINEKSIYPERFDLGLNLIQKKNHTIVPELVICHELESRRNSRTFPHFQIAAEVVQLVRDYYSQHKQIFLAIQKKIQNRDPSILTGEYVFPNSRDPNLELLKVYIWLVKQDNANLILANKASKVIPRKGIKEIEKILEQQDLNLIEETKKTAQKPLYFNPNFLIPKYNDCWIPPLFTKKPNWHIVGDRVVNLKINGFNFAPFGATGTVVGILGNKPENGVLEVKVEVMFDRPFVGGTNLGGRCEWGRGAIVDFDDVFNLNSWFKFLKPRDKRQNHYFQGWDGVISRHYIPSFQMGEDFKSNETGNVPQNANFRSIATKTRELKGVPSDQLSGSQQTHEDEAQHQQSHKQQFEVQQKSHAQQREPQPQVNQWTQGLAKHQNQNQIHQAQTHHQSQPYQTHSQKVEVQQKPNIQHGGHSETQTNVAQQLQWLASQTQGQTHVEQKTQAKPVSVIPKTLGLNQASNNPPKATTQFEERKLSDNNAPAKVEQKGGFSFDTLLNSNLAKNLPSSHQMSEEKIKDALKIHDNKQHKLNLNAQSFTIVSRPNPLEAKNDASVRAVDVGNLEKNLGSSTSQSQSTDFSEIQKNLSNLVPASQGQELIQTIQKEAFVVSDLEKNLNSSNNSSQTAQSIDFKSLEKQLLGPKNNESPMLDKNLSPSLPLGHDIQKALADFKTSIQDTTHQEQKIVSQYQPINASDLEKIISGSEKTDQKNEGNQGQTIDLFKLIGNSSGLPINSGKLPDQLIDVKELEKSNQFGKIPEVSELEGNKAKEEDQSNAERT